MNHHLFDYPPQICTGTIIYVGHTIHETRCGCTHVITPRIYAYNLPPSNRIIQRRYYNDVIRRNQVLRRWPDGLEEGQIELSNDTNYIKRVTECLLNVAMHHPVITPLVISPVIVDGQRFASNSYDDSIGHRPFSLPLFFYSNESNKKQKGVGKPRTESTMGMYVYMYVWVCVYAQPRWFTFRWRGEYSFSPPWKWTPGKNGRVINVPRVKHARLFHPDELLPGYASPPPPCYGPCVVMSTTRYTYRTLAEPRLLRRCLTTDQRSTKIGLGQIESLV